MKKILGILITLTLMLSFLFMVNASRPCAAEGPTDPSDAYQQALDYLANHQNADGSWGSLPERDTFLTVEALSWCADPYPYEESLGLAYSFISELVGHNTDTISRKVFFGYASQEEYDFFNASRNEDGGYALAPGLPSTPLDTSLCLKGLLGDGNFEHIQSTLAYLTDSISTDGYYSLYPGGPADLLTTSAASKALNLVTFIDQFSGMSNMVGADLADTRESVDAYLASIQRSDGGFGEQGSTAYETALVLGS